MTTHSTSTGSTDPPPSVENVPAEPDHTERTTSCLSLDNARLLDIIEISYDLIDVLQSRGVLTQQQVDHIHSSDTTVTGRIRGLLAEVKKLSHEQQEQFLSALDETQQSHVTNYIRNNGKRPTATTDDWPIFEFEQYRKIEQNRSKLIELIDSRHGLLDLLRSVQCVNRQQEQVIISKQSVMADSNKILLYVIMRRSLKDFKNFVDCLLKTKQEHVVSLLEPRLAMNSQPVSEQNKKALNKHYPTLVQLIDLKHLGLLDELYAGGVITLLQKEYIESAETQSDCNRRILETVERGSQSGFDKFIECLCKTGHQHVADLFGGEGAVTAMVAHTSGSGNLADHEIQAVEQFKQVFANTSSLNRQLMLGLLESYGIQLIALTTRHSIKLFYVCSSLTALTKLNQFYVSGQLKNIIQQLLAYLLDNKYHISVDRLVWKMSDYCECAHHLLKAQGLHINSHIHQLALLQPDIDREHSSSELSSNGTDLPHELIEQMLLKAAGQLFVDMKDTTTRAHLHALTMLQSVCRYWQVTLTNRRRDRQLLRRYFKHVCIPFRFDPKLATKLRIQNGSITVGIAELNNKLYVATSASNRIQVFSVAQPGYKLGEDVVLPHLRRPLDMVACNKTNCLYVSDIETYCIWRVTAMPLSIEKAVDKWITTDYVPWTLSLQTNRLAVTARDGPAMYVYSCEDGTLVRKVNQPSYMFARHSIETLDGTAIVCHRNWIGDEDPEHRPGASELNYEGKVLQRYQGAVKLDQPYYLTMDSKQHILVCDRHKMDIVHLNRELKLKQAVLTRRELSGQPQRLCYNEQRGLLYVSYSDLPLIDVYRI